MRAEVRPRQNDVVIRGVGIYYPDGVVDGVDDSAKNVPSELDSTGRHTREFLTAMRDQASDIPDGFAWIGLVNPTKPELAMVAEIFELETLQVEDAANHRQRAKVDVSDDGSVFTVIKTLGYDPHTNEVDTGQVAIFTGRGYAITVRHGDHGDLTSVRSRIRASRVLRAHGPLAVLYSIMDMTVDGYLAVIDEVSDDVGDVETLVFGMNPPSSIAQTIYGLKRENMEVRRAVHPLTRVAHDFADETFELIPEDLKPYFRDVGEHILRVYDTVEQTDSLLMTMLMASTAVRDLQQNADARKISAWVAIAAVPTVVGGIYGMNFRYMPELEWRWSYPVVLGVIGLACVLLYRGFKRNGWL